MKRFVLGILVAACGLLLWRLACVADPREAASGEPATRAAAPEPVAAGLHGGIEPRDVTAAGLAGKEWSSDPDRLSELRAAAANAPHLASFLAEQGKGWAPTRVWAEDPFEDEAVRRECWNRFAGDLQDEGLSCSYTLSLVVESQGESLGRVKYAAAELAPGQDERCDVVVGCAARRRLGAEVPLPDDARSEIAMRQNAVVKTAPAFMLDADHLDEVKGVFAEDIRRAQHDLDVEETRDPELYFNYLKQLRIIEFIEQQTKELRDNPELR